MSATTFQLEELGGDLASAIPELAVGPWTCAPAGLVAFGAGEQPAPRWRVGLGRDDAANQLALAGGERSVAHTHAVLDDVPLRLDRAIDRALAELSRAARPTPPPGPVAAATRESPTWGRLASLGLHAPLAPEARLIAALTGDATPLQLDQLAWSAEPAIGAPAASAEQDPGRLAQLLERVADLARGRSRIETQIEGALVAHSMMTLSGDTEVWITPRLSVAGARLHARSVAVATRTRHAWARILTLLARGCARLAALGLPAAGVAALPVVWRFLRDLLREARALRAAQIPA